MTTRCHRLNGNLTLSIRSCCTIHKPTQWLKVFITAHIANLEPIFSKSKDCKRPTMAVAMAGTLATTKAASSLTANLNAEHCMKPSLRSRSHSSSLSLLPKSRLVVRAQSDNTNGRRAAVVGLGVALFSAFTLSGNANAGLVEDLLAKSAANKELNDAKRLATSGANIARAYTVQFGTCQFPYNFTGCQDLAKLKNVKFLTDDIKLECQGKDKYKCGSNVFWQGK